jgi:hypothetical protein
VTSLHLVFAMAAFYAVLAAFGACFVRAAVPDQAETRLDLLRMAALHALRNGRIDEAISILESFDRE